MVSNPSRPGHPLTSAKDPRRLPGRALLRHSHTGLHFASRYIPHGEDTISLNYGPAPSRRPLIGPGRLLLAGHPERPGKRKSEGDSKGRNSNTTSGSRSCLDGNKNYKSQQSPRLRRPAPTELQVPEGTTNTFTALIWGVVTKIVTMELR